MKQILTHNYSETQDLGFNLGKNLKNGKVFALYGNLGSGKTTFVQGLAKGLGIKQKIISPTFIIVRKYAIPKSLIPALPAGRFNLKSFYHIDLYRIENETGIKGLGLEEILNDDSNVVAIEWPEKLKNLLPKKRTNLFFEYLDNDLRKIEIK